jgi:predicted RNase H-like HicB family nuclease
MKTFKIHLHKEDKDGYMANVPTLPGCITYGETVAEAIVMVKEAIELYIEELQDREKQIPDDSEILEYSLTLTNGHEWGS